MALLMGLAMGFIFGRCSAVNSKAPDAPIEPDQLSQVVKTPPFHGGNAGSIPVCVTIHAEVMEQADRADSKSVAARRVGSNPTFSTIFQDWRNGP